MVLYKRRVQFYETDAQGIVHHSNYARYFEESRGELLRYLNLPYSHLRSLGYEVVLTEIYCKFKKPCYYDELLDIHVNVKELSKYFFAFSYEIQVNGEVRVLGETKHALLRDGKLVSIKGNIKNVLERARS